MKHDSCSRDASLTLLARSINFAGFEMRQFFFFKEGYRPNLLAFYLCSTWLVTTRVCWMAFDSLFAKKYFNVFIYFNVNYNFIRFKNISVRSNSRDEFQAVFMDNCHFGSNLKNIFGCSLAAIM